MGIIFENVLYFKITTNDLQEKFKNEGSKQFNYTKKNKPEPVVIKNWWSAPDRVIDDSDAMVELVELVLEQK